ncbi:MAG: lysylphosphatidylglycerol synthase transmembrane domain-containing protein, partial [Thermodesulfobacteriota bacterium]|nr:lysylphosphatidylglycerol synthase transmembrane domain-containing protein [Thermodesulfobacteriota bacterium]
VSKAGAFISVFIERITGISALMFIGFIGGIFSYLQTGNEISRLVVFGGSLGLGILILFVLTIKFTASPLKRQISKILPQRFQGIVEHLKDYRHNNRKILMVIFLSLFFQLFLLFYRLLLIYAVGASISIANLAVVVALSTIVALVPISINGIGLLDGSFIYLLANFNVGYEQAFIVMILIRLLNFPLGLIGGIFYFFDKKTLRVDPYGLGELKKGV